MKKLKIDGHKVEIQKISEFGGTYYVAQIEGHGCTNHAGTSERAIMYAKNAIEEVRIQMLRWFDLERKGEYDDKQKGSVGGDDGRVRPKRADADSLPRTSADA